MKKLHMTFLNEDGSKKTLVIRCVHQELTPAAVKEAMEQIVALELFEKNGLRLMTEVHSAKYVETIETVVFDVNVAPVPTPASNAIQPEISEESKESQIADCPEKQENQEGTTSQSEPVPDPAIQAMPTSQSVEAGLWLLGECWQYKQRQLQHSLRFAHLAIGLNALQKLPHRPAKALISHQIQRE